MTEHETEITSKSIREGLEKMGLKKGDRIVMHSSLMRLGKAKYLAALPHCGLDYILQAFRDILGPAGILAVPTFTSTFLKATSGPTKYYFDAVTTPSRVGDVTNAILEIPGRARSLHPTHSWAAIGADAGELVKGHDKTSTFGRDSVCGRFYDWDFKLVWFGTAGNTNTSAHFAEDWLDLPYMTSEDALVKDGDTFKKVTVYRSPSGPRDFYKKTGSKLDNLLESVKFMTVGKVHQATVTVMRHRDFMNLLLKAMIQDPCLLLSDNQEDDYHKLFYKLHAEYMAHFRKKHGDNIPAFLNPKN